MYLTRLYGVNFKEPKWKEISLLAEPDKPLNAGEIAARVRAYVGRRKALSKQQKPEQTEPTRQKRTRKGIDKS